MWARRLIFKHKQWKTLMFIWSDCRLSGRFLSGQHRRAPWSSWPGRAGPYPWPLGSSSGQTSELSSGRGMYNNWSRWPGLRIAGSIISGLLVAPIMKTLRPLSGYFNSLRPFWYRSVDQKAPVLLATILAIKEFLWLTWSVFDTQGQFFLSNKRCNNEGSPIRTMDICPTSWALEQCILNWWSFPWLLTGCYFVTPCIHLAGVILELFP